MDERAAAGGEDAGGGLWAARALAGLAVFLGIAWRYRLIPIDDPYITFRYARNVLEGQGWVFNPGGGSVEGYSNFLWVLASTVPLMAGWDPLLFAQVLGLAFGGAAIGWLALGVGRDSEGRRWGAAPWGGVLLGFSYPWAVWAVGGLETVSYGFLVLASCLLLARVATRPGGGMRWVLAVVLAGAAMSRVEGPVVLLAAGLAFLVADGHGRRALGQGVGACLVVLVVYHGWRLAVFGTLVPATVTAKVGGPLGDRLGGGLLYLAQYVVGAGGVLLAVGGWWGLRRARAGARVGWRESEVMALLAVSLVLVQGVFVLGVGGDWMPGLRFVVPVLPLVAYLAGRALEELPRAVAPGVCLAALVLVPVETRYERMDGYDILEWLRREADGERVVDPLLRIGEDMRGLTGEGATIALTEAGAVPFASGRRVIDMLGLTDGEIARTSQGLHRLAGADVALAREPEYMLLAVLPGGSGAFAPDRDLLASEEFQGRYREVHRWVRKFHEPRSGGAVEGHMVLFRRSESD